MRIGERIHDLLTQKGLSQSDLADYLNTSRSTIHGWKQENRNPSAELIVPISEFLKVSLYYLLTGMNPQKHELLNDAEIEQLISEYRDLDKKGKLAVRGTIIQELQRLETGQDATSIMEIKKSKSQSDISGETHQNKPIKRQKPEEKQAQ